MRVREGLSGHFETKVFPVVTGGTPVQVPVNRRSYGERPQEEGGNQRKRPRRRGVGVQGPERVHRRERQGRAGNPKSRLKCRSIYHR